MEFEPQPKMEERILNFWEENSILSKARKLRKGKKKWFFMDGPPYATGAIHLGTALNKILKDFYIRFHRMLDYDVWDQPGYDCHGLPIENKVEKKLNFKVKSDIEKFGVENFIQECRKFATQYIDVMTQQFKNLGVWMDWDNPYLTLTNNYIEGAWTTFKAAYEKGYLFKGSYPVHVCPRCETAVAYNEIEYKTVKDPAIYVKFKVEGEKNVFLVIWTTTPWTLPGNTGVMVKPSAEYVKVKVPTGEVFILAKALAGFVLDKLGFNNYEVLGTVKGWDLGGLRYEHPLADLFPFQKKLKNAHRVVLSEQFVTLTEGTGLVHSAPGHGQEDYKVGLETGLPVVSPVKISGVFDESCGKFAGMYVKEADKLIINELKSRKLLLLEEEIEHEYPHCWRCESPLLLISMPQWFFKVTEIKDKLIEESKKVNWVPKWAGERFLNWIENLGDWPISRQRYWGIPLPIWICEKCGEVKVVGSADELGVELKDLHRPYIDQVKLKCPKCGGTMYRIPDVLDVWFDSGVASWASLGYPKRKDLWKKLWPTDFETEGPDQIRGWWNSQLITSVLTFGRSPFGTIMFHGFILDAHGVKMAKKRGNVILPEDVTQKYGRDILRFYLLSSAPWNNFFFNMDEVKEVSRQFNVLKNTFHFIEMYVTEKPPEKVDLLPEDKWLLSKLYSTIKEYREACLKYNHFKAAKLLMDFILNDLSRWYIKAVRDRVWPLYQGKDKKAAFYTLLKTTEETLKLLAPFAPFTAEELYQKLLRGKVCEEESIHFLLIPEPEKEHINKELEEEMEVLREIIEAVSSARQKAKVKLRWPVKKVVVVSESKQVEKTLNRFKQVFLKMSNAKDVEFRKERIKGSFVSEKFSFGEVFIDLTVDDKILSERVYRELTRRIQLTRKKHGFKVLDKILLTIKTTSDLEKGLKKLIEDFKRDVSAEKIEFGILKGEITGNIKFENDKVEFSFTKI